MSTPTTITRAKKMRRRRNVAESLPQYLPTATEFSDDPDLMDPVFVMKAIKDELGSGNGPLGNLWNDVQEQTTLQRPGGRPRANGDWALLYAAGYVLSQQAEMAAFWRGVGTEDLFAEAGFDAKLSYQSTYLRFVELEAEQCVKAFDAAADKLIQHARSKEPRIGREVFVDGASIHSRARLHHDCPDPAKCKAAGGNPRAILEIAAPDDVKQARKEEAEEPAEETTVHPAALEEAEDQTGRYQHYLKLNGHRYGVLDRDAGARQYAAGGAGWSRRDGCRWLHARDAQQRRHLREEAGVQGLLRVAAEARDNP